MFCKDTDCPRHGLLEQFSGEEYLAKKAEHCRDCHAWKFLNWLRENNWRILLPIADMSEREIAARLKGVDVANIEHLTTDEIMSL